MSRTPPKQTGDPETTGHSWDGIEEFNNPLPRWWLWAFYATIVWGVGYTIAYPAWPGISKATAGVLGYSTRAEVASEIAAVDAANAAINARLETTDLTAMAADPALLSYATNAGAAVFRTWCAQCHGSGAAGAQAGGYPNLLDDDWLWGGDITAIHETISYGIRNEENPDARFSMMPPFGRDELIDGKEISHVVNYDLPNIAESYVHRIGRTARAGREGTAIAFCDETESEYLRDIEKLSGKRLVIREHDWHFPEAIPSPAARGSKRPSRPGHGNNRNRNRNHNRNRNRNRRGPRRD